MGYFYLLSIQRLSLQGKYPSSHLFCFFPLLLCPLSLAFVSNSLSFVPLEQITLLCDKILVPECPVPTSWPLPDSHLSRALEGFAEKKKIMKDDY